MTTTPCLWFDTQGEDAARFYCSVFPNSRILNVTHYGPDTPRPEGTVMTVDFELDGQKFVALNGGPEFHFSEAVSFMIDCRDQAEVDHYWTSLTVGGGEESVCGWLKDRYGLSWQIVPRRLYELMEDADPARATAATEAMLRMGKIVVAELEAAADAAG